MQLFRIVDIKSIKINTQRMYMVHITRLYMGGSSKTEEIFEVFHMESL